MENGTARRSQFTPPPRGSGLVGPTANGYVFFNKNNQVPKDATHQDGWDYDAASNTVTFHGPACQALQEGAVTSLDIVFGCADEKIPPPPGCESGLGCDVEHPCPTDPKEGAGFCQEGCCVFGKF
jgi:hypothetical protein